MAFSCTSTICQETCGDGAYVMDPAICLRWTWWAALNVSEATSGHSAGAQLYHNNTNWQLSYRPIGYPNGPNACTHYDIICGTNAILTFKGKWWAQWSSRVYVACISLKVMVGPYTQLQWCDPGNHINGWGKSQIPQGTTFKIWEKQNNWKKTQGFQVNVPGKYRICVQVNGKNL